MESKKSNRGGKRVGAGRKPTSREVKKTSYDVIKLWREGQKIEPMTVMLEAMESVYKDSGSVAAFALAQAIAPYMHAKQTATMELTGANGKDLVPKSNYFGNLANLSPGQIEALGRGLGAIDDNEYDLDP